MPANNDNLTKNGSQSSKYNASTTENQIENCVLSSAGIPATFEITDAKLYVLIVTLSTKDNVKLARQLSDGFKRSAY